MKRELANLLLSEIMSWTPEDVEKYRERLDDLADWKYDQYQQYRPGSRFIENLSIWLNHFETPEERTIAFDFVLNNLIFISPNEMNHLISIVYPDVVFPQIKLQAKNIAKLKGLSLSIDEKKQLVKLLRTQTLFLGLSDGARTDVFRRANPVLSHEQICLSYDIPNEKYEKISKEIDSEVAKLKLQPPLQEIASERTIKNIVLLDDFSASGISFIRKDEESDKWKGKISTLIRSLEKNEYDLSNVQIFIILYLSTEHAISHIFEKMSYFEKKIQAFI